MASSLRSKSWPCSTQSTSGRSSSPQPSSTTTASTISRCCSCPRSTNIGSQDGSRSATTRFSSTRRPRPRFLCSSRVRRCMPRAVKPCSSRSCTGTRRRTSFSRSDGRRSFRTRSISLRSTRTISRSR
eukprot:Amastigsp_a177466_9.p6 type:complete len:128 gc:universal Amastigsp_a177466_9:1045-1428(+)